MTPYYTDDYCTIYHGDCREVLPSLRAFDAVITSPPYNTLRPDAAPSGLHAERATGRNAWMDKQGNYSDQLPEDEYRQQQNELLGLCLQSASCAWINHKVRYRDGWAVHPARLYDAPIYAEVIWDRGGSMALNCRRFSPSHECWLCFGRPKCWNNDENKRMSVWRIAPSRDVSDHPCPYPAAVVAPIVRACVGAGGCVDPYCGTGTTIRAAKDLGRHAIGIEIEERYCEIAANRLRQEVLPLW